MSCSFWLIPVVLKCDFIATSFNLFAVFMFLAMVGHGMGIVPSDQRLPPIYLPFLCLDLCRNSKVQYKVVD